MTADVGIQSIDAVNTDDWLVCTRGPIQYKKDGKSFYPPEWEGVVCNVLAVSPPMLLVRLFPFPINNRPAAPIEAAIHWDRQRFGRATTRYVDEYLKLAGYNRAGKRVRGGEPPVIPPLPGDKPKRVTRSKAKSIEDILDGLRKKEEEGEDNE